MHIHFRILGFRVFTNITGLSTRHAYAFLGPGAGKGGGGGENSEGERTREIVEESGEGDRAKL